MPYEELKNTGVTAKTPSNILLGAGTIHKGLTFTSNAWNFATSLIGATSGGTKLTLKPELMDIELDGANVKAKGLTVKTGETAVMEINFAELTPDILALSTIGTATASTDYTGYQEIKSRAQITTGDYVADLAFVGKTVDGKPIIILFDNALCTSGFEIEGKSKENGVLKLTFECYADLGGNLDTLPYRILYPTGA